ncbi:hypothetical protein M5K25_027419 [Dendrobium thyrsiflorum]|uniref:Uncharacterized protein n=1 Tax=Dendrobium thyrsiflorum TaxID=117978 RepID=A0ABD0TZY5_DENTH
MPSQLPSQSVPHRRHHHHHHFHCHCFPLLHRHHHHHLLFAKFAPSPLLCPCPLHHNHHHHHHFNSCSSNLHLLAINPRVISSIPPNPCPVPAGFFSGCPTVSTAAEALVSESGVEPMDQSEVLKLEDPGEEEELEDVFVLTDEWREFFAKSEAKRRMDKQQKNEHRK